MARLLSFRELTKIWPLGEETKPGSDKFLPG
jgi:hypothetical protein